MARSRTSRVANLAGTGVDRAGAKASQASIANAGQRLLRMENLDVNVPPDPCVPEVTIQSLADPAMNSYLPFIGQENLRQKAARHVSRMTRDEARYNADQHCVISDGGLSGILNVLLALVEPGDGVLLMDPTYIGLINRVKLAGAVPIMVPLLFTAEGF